MPQPDKKQPKLLKLAEAATMLNVHPNTLRAWDESGYLKAVRVGLRQDRRYRREDIEKILKKQ